MGWSWLLPGVMLGFRSESTGLLLRCWLEELYYEL